MVEKDSSSQCQVIGTKVDLSCSCSLYLELKVGIVRSNGIVPRVEHDYTKKVK